MPKKVNDSADSIALIDDTDNILHDPESEDSVGWNVRNLVFSYGYREKGDDKFAF